MAGMPVSLVQANVQRHIMEESWSMHVRVGFEGGFSRALMTA
jgi:hypothetical protein